MLVDSLYFTCIELERLRRVSSKDEHISVVQLNTGDRLRADELHVVDLKLIPLLTSHGCSILTRVRITVIDLRRTCVEQVDEQVVGNLALSIVSRHEVNPTFVHHHSCRINSLTRQRIDVKPVVRDRIIALTSLSRHRPPSKTT